MSSMSDWIHQYFPGVIQNVTASVRRAAQAFVSRFWADQNNQTDEEEQRPSTRRPNAGSWIDINHTQGKEVVKYVIPTSAGGLLTGVFAAIGDEKAVLLHNYFFTAFIILCQLSFISGVALNLLIGICPETRGFVKIVKFTTYFCQGTFLYAISCVVCLVFPSNFGVVFILVAPPIPFGLIAILSSARWGQGSIP